MPFVQKVGELFFEPVCLVTDMKTVLIYTKVVAILMILKDA